MADPFLPTRSKTAWVRSGPLFIELQKVATASFPDMGLALADLTLGARVGEHGGSNDEQRFYTGSQPKIAILLAAFRLRERARASGKSGKSQEKDAPRAKLPHVLEALRPLTRAPVIGNTGFDKARGNAALAAGQADAIAFGVPFLANPDLPERLRRDAPLNKPDPATFHGEGPRGYTDYPTLDAGDGAPPMRG